MLSLIVLLFFPICQVLSEGKLDPHFAVDPEDLQLREISDNVRKVSGAVMGLAEYVLDIRQDLKLMREELSDSKISVTTSRPDNYFSKLIRDPEETRRQSLELADKVERLLAMDQSPEVDLAKEELKRTVEKNFLRMLAAILVTGPTHTQERSDDIFKLMRSVLNGELDFTPVVQRLPLILRDSETNQFVNLLLTLRESERGGSSFRLYNSVESIVVPEPDSSFRQNNRVTGTGTATNTNANTVNNNGQATGSQNVNTATASPNQLPTINSILDAMTQTNQLIKELPTLIEGLQTIIDSLESLVG